MRATIDLFMRGVEKNMWTVVYMAQSKEVADKLNSILSSEGILVKLRPVSKTQDSGDNYFEVLVPESEVEEAHNIIIEKGY